MMAEVLLTYRCSYDDADNFVTKTVPIFDDFDDGDYKGWTVDGGTWSAANGYIANSSSGSTSRIKHAMTNGDVEVRLSFKYTGSAGYAFAIVPRWRSNSSVYVRIYG